MVGPSGDEGLHQLSEFAAQDSGYGDPAAVHEPSFDGCVAASIDPDLLLKGLPLVLGGGLE